MGKTLTAIGIGEILWDVLPGGKRIGGAPGNFVYHAKEFGAKPFVISAIGNDDFGVEIIKELKLKDIPVETIQINDKPTGTVNVLINSQGEPEYTIHENVAWDYISFDESLQQISCKADIICFGTLAQRSRVSRETIKKILKAAKPEALIVYDINLRQHYFTKEIIENSLKQCNILKLNEDELPVLCNILKIAGKTELDKINILIEEFKLKLVAWTKGAEGSFLITPAENSYLPTPKVKVKNTVGAGDAFTAAMVVNYAEGIPLKEVHEKAVGLAAFICTSNGAMPKYKYSNININILPS